MITGRDPDKPEPLSAHSGVVVLATASALLKMYQVQLVTLVLQVMSGNYRT